VASKFYVEGDARAARVEDLFATIAPRYDLINDLQSFGLHRLWKRRLIRLAGIRPGELALDVCCGTGDVAFALAAAGATVTGFDFSEPMLAVAGNRARAAAPGASPVFQQGDALNLPFADASLATNASWDPPAALALGSTAVPSVKAADAKSPTTNTSPEGLTATPLATSAAAPWRCGCSR
jgi:SAM-dependent methyltransferase